MHTEMATQFCEVERETQKFQRSRQGAQLALGFKFAQGGSDAGSIEVVAKGFNHGCIRAIIWRRVFDVLIEAPKKLMGLIKTRLRPVYWSS